MRIDFNSYSIQFKGNIRLKLLFFFTFSVFVVYFELFLAWFGKKKLQQAAAKRKEKKKKHLYANCLMFCKISNVLVLYFQLFCFLFTQLPSYFLCLWVFLSNNLFFSYQTCGQRSFIRDICLWHPTSRLCVGSAAAL